MAENDSRTLSANTSRRASNCSKLLEALTTRTADSAPFRRILFKKLDSEFCIHGFPGYPEWCNNNGGRIMFCIEFATTRQGQLKVETCLGHESML